MWPVDALPQRGITNWSFFTANKDTNTATGWQSWMKPPGCNWVYILAVGAGGGGARPLTGIATTGGGGGGSGSITRALFPAQMFPDIIYVRPGQGGAGATVQNTNGADGTVSYVCIAPNTTAQNIIFSFTAGLGGASAGTGGGPGVSTTATSGIWYNAAIFTSIVGQSGSNGAVAANGSGSNITFGGLFITGGAGGGNGTGAGGNITGAGPMPTISGGAAGAGGDAGPGRAGFNEGVIIAPGLKTFPMMFSGGSGGGGVNTNNNAGRGGDGAYGCGGGGGGSGRTTDASAGRGGDGGDAFILIGAF